ncbi:MAG: Fe-S protein assembly co-chaperone HscB [Planctomycetota bacterium]
MNQGESTSSVRPTDAFKALGVPARFDLDGRHLRQALAQRLARSHPDASGDSSASIDLNGAYRQIADPLGRAEELLRVFAAPEVDRKALPPGFLLEMMELRERADAAAGDAAALRGLRVEAEAMRSDALERIRTAFASVTGERITAEAAAEVACGINVVRSFDRMLEQLDREGGALG